ncbi:MAG TPA: sulfatase [Phycisphaeraceae bacterium]
MHRPNILYIHSHDTGRYVQPYGYALRTPRIQRLAEEGVLFRQAFCVNPTCSPSRASLLTGCYPHQNGMIGLTHRGSRLRDPRQHLAHVLKAAGYATVLCGVQHEASDPSELGYEEVHADRSGPAIAQHAVELIRRPHDRPFFLAVGFFETHRTKDYERGVRWHNDQPVQGDPRYVRPPAPLPDTPQTRQDFADYAVAAERLDRQMGAVFDALDQAGLAENTLVICTTDHGIAFPGMKCNLTDHGLGVMLILRGPGGFIGGKVVDAMVSHMDLFPTICELIDLDKPAWLEGKSLLPLIRGEVDRLHETLFASVNYHAAYEPMRAVRTDRYKYIRRFEPRSGPVLANADHCVSKEMWIEHGWAQRAPAVEQLYDLIFDPNEANNLVTSDRSPQVLQMLEDMRQRLAQWMRDTNDPLQSGYVEPYPGMIITDTDADRPEGSKLLPGWRPQAQAQYQSSQD